MLNTDFNRLSWQRLGLQIIDAASSLPAEFHRGQSFADLARLQTQPELTLVTAPFNLSGASKAYLAGLTPDDYAAMVRTSQEYCHDHAGVISYPMFMIDLSIRHTYAEAFRRKEMEKCLPDRAGRSELIDDISRLMADAKQAMQPAAPKIDITNARLTFSPGWLPMPEEWWPHHDTIRLGGRPGIRQFLPLHGHGPLVVPALMLEAHQRQIDKDDNSLYPSFAEIAAQAAIFQVGNLQAAAWRSGPQAMPEDCTSSLPLPHAVPPHYSNQGIRANLVLDLQ